MGRTNATTVGVTAVVTIAMTATLLPAIGNADHTPAPTSVSIAGSLQDELGCPGDWQPDCAVTDLSSVIGAPGDSVWRGEFSVPAGDWEYKVPLNDTWDESYGANGGGDNIALSLADEQPVRFYYSHETHWVADNVNERIVTAPGSFQSELGCTDDWQPDCLATWLQDLDGDGTYTFSTSDLPAGSYEGKAAINEAWDENYGAGGVANGDNITFTVTDGQTVTFEFVSATNEITITTSGGGGSGAIEPGDELLVSDAARPGADESIYFVMTDRFENGDPSNDQAGLTGDRLQHGFDPTDKAFHHGGDLAGLVSQLDYIESLGTTAIWITPPFKNDYVQTEGGPGSESSSYHGYWQVDYTQIDPHYGTNAEMQAFVADAQSRGIKVLFDVVPNHTGDVITYEEGVFSYRNKADFPYTDADGNVFDDRDFEGTGTFPDLDPATSFPYTPVIPAGEETAKAPAWLNDPIYYHNRGNSTFVGENSQYGDFFGLDDLFHEHPVVVDGMIDIHQNMITEFGIDGFRVDTVKHVSDGFWEAFVPAIFEHAESLGDDDFIMFGEVFGESVEFRARYSTELDFEGTLDFGFDSAAKRFATSAPTTELADFFASDDHYTDHDSSAHSLATFIGSHDTGRFAQTVRGADPSSSDAEQADRVTLGYALNFFTRGRPVVYYGDEQGFVGDGGDQDARQNMFPSQVASYNDDDLIGTDATTADSNFDQTHPLFTAISEFAAIRSAHPALQTGAQITRSASGSAGVFAFSRIEATEQVEYVVALNNSESAASATFGTDTSNATWTPILGSSGATSDADGNLTVDVPALGAVVLRAETTVDTDGSAAIAMVEPAADSELTGNVPVSADVTDGGFAQVTFAVSVDGGDYAVIGSDDNAPYRVYHDVSDLPVGAIVTYKAIVEDAAGNLASDKVSAIVGEEVIPEPPSDLPYAIVHYLRDDGDYGDETTGDFNDFWGLHLWGEAIAPEEVTEWPSPKPFLGEDEYGRFAWIALQDTGKPINFIVHRGDTKDGTQDDRSFDPAVTPEIWLRQDDPNAYSNQAEAQGYVTLRYQRPDGDYGDPTSSNYEDFWGLHIWGDGADASELTEWTSPKPPTRIEDDGAYWEIAVGDVSQPLNFIIHRGDEKDPGPDQSMVPADDASIFVQSGDETVFGTRAAAVNEVEIHYHRPDGDYGDPTSSDFNDFWGLHVWEGAESPTQWPDPVRPDEFSKFGAVYRVPLVDGATQLAYIIHRGDEKDPGPDQFLNLELFGHEVFQLSGADPEGTPYLLPLLGGPGVQGDLTEERAHWVDESTIVWATAESGANTYLLCGAPEGGMELTEDGIAGGDCVELTKAGTYPTDVEGFKHLGGLPTLQIAADDRAGIGDLLTGQLAVVMIDPDGVRLDGTGLQIPGVLDDLYATDTELGVTWDGPTPTISVWAPTAKTVVLRHYENSRTDSFETVEMVRSDDGVWSVTGRTNWKNDFFLFEVEVFAPSTGSVETNLVTDPYSLSLSLNSERTQIVDLDDRRHTPWNWDRTEKPELVSPEDISVYELHVRDFSISDETVPRRLQGTYGAFTRPRSDGMQHLAELADAGLTHIHLLPVFDIATIEEDPALRQEVDAELLATYAPDSDQQQAAVSAINDLDGFNWGYDPYHYTVPEGSYSTRPNGSRRIREFRSMVQSLNQTDLRVVMDVVYNHTNSAGQAETSVLDRIVPGYYHRLDETGTVATSTCCANTATEHEMMGRLMVDSVVTWATEYKVDGFRFDLMGHHSKQNMLDVRAALDELTLEDDGVDGSSIYLYGEGWNFGEVADDARFEQATQLNMAGTGIGTFSDRLRDAVRGGGPFDDGQALLDNQGLINGLWYDENGGALTGDAALDELLLSADQVRVGLAGN
ncbi:MAG: pullulanase-type alpha-1,6-glucosidase, partial [Actinomycetota bacterium]